MRSKLETIHAQVQALADPSYACNSQRFFKTGPGEYGEGDVFVGLRVPQVRKLAAQHDDADMDVIEALLHSELHEERLLALLMLVRRFKKADTQTRGEIYRSYLRNWKAINNWDLVDLSADHIVGQYLLDRSKAPLYKLAKSPHLWRRRIAIVATFRFIKHNRFGTTLEIAEILIGDSHDLIHKAVGWMLREVGNRDRHVLEAFLKKHYRNMPRTMLRYAIERLPEDLRQAYLKGTVA